MIEKAYKLEFLEKPKFLGIKITIVPVIQQSILSKEQKSNGNGRSKLHLFRFLQHVISNSQEKWGNETCYKPQTTEQVSRKETFQNGQYDKSDTFSQKGRFRSNTRCLLSYQDFQISQKISSVPISWESLPVSSTVFWSHGSSPNIYKIVSVVAAHLRMRGIRLATYLDDWLALNAVKNGLLKDRETIHNLLFRLGFIINKGKSHLIVTQSLTYIGGWFNLALGLVFPTPERVV